MGTPLNSLIGEVGCISFDEVVNHIHKHIGLDNEIEKAEQILMYILDSHIDKDDYKNDNLTLYHKISGVWQSIPITPYSEYSNFVVTYSSNFFTSPSKHNFYNYSEILTKILEERQRQRELADDVPF